MTSGVRLGLLGAVGVVTAGLAQAGWLALLAWSGGAGATAWWMPLGVQVAITGVLALAVGWQLWRSAGALQRQIDDLRGLPVSPPGPASSSPLADRLDFLQRLTARLADRSRPESALLVLTVLPAPGANGADAGALQDVADLLQTYPTCVHGAFAGRLADDQFALCLPAHGVVGESALSLIGAAQAVQGRHGRLRCLVGAVDDLGGSTLTEALEWQCRASHLAKDLGPGEVVVLSARQAADRPVQAMSPA